MAGVLDTMGTGVKGIMADGEIRTATTTTTDGDHRFDLIYANFTNIFK
jgi:hypothetical protein